MWLEFAKNMQGLRPLPEMCLDIRMDMYNYRMNLYAYTLGLIFYWNADSCFINCLHVEMKKKEKKKKNCKNRIDLPFISDINSKQKHADKNTT